MSELIFPDPWPNTLDGIVLSIFLAAVVGLPALGYWFMICDVRVYLRSLRRSLVVASRFVWGVPEWAAAETPRELLALGLRWPCTDDDIKCAYRRRVKQLHPDRGGDERRFLLLQAQFEAALAWLARQQAEAPVRKAA